MKKIKLDSYLSVYYRLVNIQAPYYTFRMKYQISDMIHLLFFFFLIILLNSHIDLEDNLQLKMKRIIWNNWIVFMIC